jgi:hypothetical protein
MWISTLQADLAPAPLEEISINVGDFPREAHIVRSDDDGTRFCLVPRWGDDGIFIGARSGSTLWQPGPRFDVTTALAADPLDRWIALGRESMPVGNPQGALDLYSFATGDPIATLATTAPRAACFAPDGRSILISRDRWLAVLDLESLDAR